MAIKINENTGIFIKRQAKKIASQQLIPHHEALDKSAVAAGFKNWKHFINVSKNLSKNIEVQNDAPTTVSSSVKVTAKVRGRRLNPHRNLLVASINRLLDDNLISLTNVEVAPAHSEKNDGHIVCELFGYPSVILWEDIGWEELRVSVWWNYNHSLHPQANLTGNRRENFRTSEPLAKNHTYKKFVGVVASCWLERKTGKYIMGKDRDKIFNIYTRSADRLALEKLPIQVPKGYAAEGKFIF
ncbi:hypothetical protein CNR22_13585 [Sphingobacteriaceae bacterium]|nr:hypothetical protein CNR22_13585 [Sphingobacteriaceae bacterium]